MSEQEHSEKRVFATDLEIGQTVQTGDGMLHSVENIELMVTIKPIAPTDAPMMMTPARTVTRWEVVERQPGFEIVRDRASGMERLRKRD